MWMLSKSVLAMMIGFFIAVIFGLIVVPLLRKLKIGQRVSTYVGWSHRNKEGTPTMGGLIFIIPTLITTAILMIMGKMEASNNLFIMMFVLLGYAILGFIDDYLIVKRHNNKGLTEVQKLFGQVLIALGFFYLFINGPDARTTIEITALNIKLENLGWLYGIFILIYLVGFSNAVNITDGLDGLAGGLSFIALLIFGILAWNSGWLTGYQDVATFCFILAGAILGFLIYNSHPAKVFMGDTGSLALGGVLASVAILVRHELLLVVVAGVFVIETISVIIQIIAVQVFHRKVFLMTPLHHHFEKLGWHEQDIVKLFWIAGLLLGMAAIVYGVWI